MVKISKKEIYVGKEIKVVTNEKGVANEKRGSKRKTVTLRSNSIQIFGSHFFFQILSQTDKKADKVMSVFDLDTPLLLGNTTQFSVRYSSFSLLFFFSTGCCDSWIPDADPPRSPHGLC